MRLNLRMLAFDLKRVLIAGQRIDRRPQDTFLIVALV